MIMDGDDIDALVFGEEGRRAAERLLTVDHRADVAGQRHFGKRHGNAAVGHVVNGAELAIGDAVADQVAGLALGGEIDGRGRALFAAMAFAQPHRLAEMSAAGADDEDDVADALEGDRRVLRPVLQQADAANRWGRQDGRAAAGRLRFVVERDVARHDREIERTAGIAHALEAADDLTHDLGPLRVGEVQAVGDRERCRAHRGQVAPRFGHRLLAALDRVGEAIARRAIGGDRQRLVGAMHADDRRIAARRLHRIGADHVVVLLPDPAAAGDVGRGHQRQQVARDIVAFGGIGERRRLGRRYVRAIVQRRFVGERTQRDIADRLALELQHHALGIGDVTDDREVQLPLAEDCLGFRLAAGLQHHQHALLRFGEHHLVRGHPRLALRHVVHDEFDADAALRRHFDRRRGEAGGAHVLDRDDHVGRHQFQARLDQQLFGEGIADLHGRALGVGILAEVRARHGRAMDAVAAGLRPDIDDRVADAAGGRIEDLVLIGDADGHRVDQDIAVIGGVEIHLAADRRHADAIAVAADAVDDAADQVAHLGVIGPAEAQRVHVGDGACAHREHIAQNAADAGRRALIGLDV